MNPKKLISKPHHKPIRNRFYFGMLASFLIFFGLGSLISCQEKPDYQDEYSERIALQLLLEPAPNPRRECNRYFTAQSECLSQSQSPEISTQALDLAILFLTVNEEDFSAPGDLDSACDLVVNSQFFQNFTEKAKSCYLDCQKDLWIQLRDTGSCTLNFSQLYSGDLELGRARLCFRTCSAVRNTSKP
jgi:hypothetical protein